jgi:hypothetical protein
MIASATVVVVAQSAVALVFLLTEQTITLGCTATSFPLLRSSKIAREHEFLRTRVKSRLDDSRAAGIVRLADKLGHGGGGQFSGCGSLAQHGCSSLRYEEPRFAVESVAFWLGHGKLDFVATLWVARLRVATARNPASLRNPSPVSAVGGYKQALPVLPITEIAKAFALAIFVIGATGFEPATS